jgi:hypothetical protein
MAGTAGEVPIQRVGGRGGRARITLDVAALLLGIRECAAVIGQRHRGNKRLDDRPCGTEIGDRAIPHR